MSVRTILQKLLNLIFMFLHFGLDIKSTQIIFFFSF